MLTKCKQIGYFILITIISGIIALLADILVKKTFIYHTIEKPHIPDECVKYRDTRPHYLSVFLLGCIVFVVLYITKLNKVVQY